MKEIKLSEPTAARPNPKNAGKYVALVDDEDYEYLSQFNWHAYVGTHTVYATRKNGKNTIRMHRELMGATTKEEEVDHEDHNGLNNQRSNLRKCSHQENAQNKRSFKGSSSRFVGVCRVDGSYIPVWRAGIKINGKFKQLGKYPYTKE